MSTSRIGTSTHELLYHFELANQRFRRMGIDAHVSDRLALAMTLRLTGTCSQDEAWEMVNEIFPQTTQPAAEPDKTQREVVRSTSEISLPEGVE